MRTILDLLGFDIYYVCAWGEYSHRYDDLDRMACRPIHSKMSVAPPWASLRVRRKKSQ